MAVYTFIATASFGLESVVARELKALGYVDQQTADGRVTFQADTAAICRANLWLRSADRVLLQFGQFDATDFGELFDQTAALPWSDLLPRDACFPVSGRSVRSALHSVPRCQAIVKKAIVESMKRAHPVVHFPEDGAEFPVEVQILRDRVTLAVDTSGAGLHRRGYRTWNAAAPLRETLAAGLLQLSYWNRERPFIDPFCGSGTIPIEAAMIARNLAPGRNREFLSQNWAVIDRSHWTAAREEVRDAQLGKPAFPILACDIDDNVLKLARRHATQAGLADDLHIQQRDVRDLQTSKDCGCVVTNPPWGARLDEPSQVESLMADAARVFSNLETWSIYVLSGLPNFEQHFGTKAGRRRKLYNGRLECTYYQYPGPRPPKPKAPKTT